MTLTDDYIELHYYDFYVYFGSNSFGPDSHSADKITSGWHGKALAVWLKDHATRQGFRLSEPTDQQTSWDMVLKLENSSWNVTCENLKYGCTKRWKISIASHHKDIYGKGGSSPEHCSKFCCFCRDLLIRSNKIKNIEWNIAALNKQPEAVNELIL